MIDIIPATSIEFFRDHMGFNPYWFWGMSDNTEFLRPSDSAGKGCRGVVKERSWMDRDIAGRADIRRAIGRAEQRMSEQLNFWPAPVYFEEEIEWPRLANKPFVRGGPYDADGRWLNVKLRNGYVQAVGVEARTVVRSGASVTYLDEDEDGYLDTAVIGPYATTITNIKEIAIYFTSNDRFGVDNGLSEKWRIHPIYTSISNGQVTIRAPAWMFVRPKLQSGVAPADIDPKADPQPFVDQVDIYRRYTDGSSTDVSSSQATIIWETRPCHGWWCICSSCVSDPFAGSPDDPAATARAIGRVGIRDARNGRVTPAEASFNSSTGTFESWSWHLCEEPDRVIVRYLAGYPLDSQGHPDPVYRELVCIMAAAELARPISGCAEANRQLYYWQQDLSKVAADKDIYATSADILDNPFGTRRGHVYVWKKIVHLARGKGIRTG